MEHRKVIDGVWWRTHVGGPWRDLPASYGNWKVVYNRRVRRDGPLRQGRDQYCEFLYKGTIDVANIRIWLRDPINAHSRDTP